MCNEQTIQQTDFANQLITKQTAIDALGEKPLVWDDLSDFDLGKAAQWSDDVDAIKALPSAQPEIILCRYCKYKEEHHYEDEGQPPIIKYTCANKVGLAKGYQVHEYDFCSRAERKDDDKTNKGSSC